MLQCLTVMVNNEFITFVMCDLLHKRFKFLTEWKLERWEEVGLGVGIKPEIYVCTAVQRWSQQVK